MKVFEDLVKFTRTTLPHWKEQYFEFDNCLGINFISKGETITIRYCKGGNLSETNPYAKNIKAYKKRIKAGAKLHL